MWVNAAETWVDVHYTDVDAGRVDLGAVLLPRFLPDMPMTKQSRVPDSDIKLTYVTFFGVPVEPGPRSTLPASTSV